MKIKNKLKSNNGASLLIALVFMMFCAFVGGALLASSTANAGRIKALKTEEQDFLSQRSAAMVVMDEMNMTNGILFTVEKTTVKTQNIHVDSAGKIVVDSETPVSTEIKISASDDGVKPFMQRLLYETAVISYLKANNISLNDVTVRLGNFKFSNDKGQIVEIFTPQNLMLYNASGNTIEECVMDIGVYNNVTEAFGDPVKAYFKCDSSSKYSMSVVFGEDPQLSIQMPAHITRDANPQNIYEDDASGNTAVRTATTTELETISWDAPVIVKGAMS